VIQLLSVPLLLLIGTVFAVGVCDAGAVVARVCAPDK
jgi:hypothetical protein